MSNVSSIFWEVYINNLEITGRARACIDSIDFDELCDGSDTCTINLSDPDFIFIEDNIFLEEASVFIRFGFVDDLYRKEFSGYIAAIDISFPQEGSPTLSITCMDNSHKMNREKKERSWDNVTRPDVVRSIASEYGFSVEIESNYEFATLETISQSNQTDIEFLENLASEEREPFMCKLIGTRLVYLKKGLLQTPITDIGYKTYPFDVMSFNPQINKETRQEEIVSSDVNTDTKEAETYTATDNNVNRDVQGESVKGSNMVYDPKKRMWIKKKG